MSFLYQLKYYVYTSNQVLAEDMQYCNIYNYIVTKLTYFDHLY